MRGLGRASQAARPDLYQNVKGGEHLVLCCKKEGTGDGSVWRGHGEW